MNEAVPVEAMQDQAKILPPSWFTEELVYFGSLEDPFILHALDFP